MSTVSPEHYELILFVNGASERSAQAITNVRDVCDNHLAGHFNLEVVDIRENAALVMRLRVLASPTLVKEQPLPVRMLVGDLSDPSRVLAALHSRVGDSTTRPR